MKKAGFAPIPIRAVALLWAACLPMGGAWSATELQAPLEASQTSSRPDWYRSLIEKGHASERMGQKQDALADYTLAIESHVLAGSDLIQVLFDRGLLLDSVGRFKDALADYSTALSLSPDFVAARNNRAGIYARLGQFAEARRDYLAALEVAGSSERRSVYFGVARVAELQGDPAGAGNFYNQALVDDPHFGLAGERLSVLVPGSGPARPGETAPAAEEIRDVPPAGRSAQLQLGAWRSEQKAARGWDHAKALASEVLEGAAARIVAVDLPGAGRFYRLRVTVAQAGSKGLCGALAAKGLDCIPVHD